MFPTQMGMFGSVSDLWTYIKINGEWGDLIGLGCNLASELF